MNYSASFTVAYPVCANDKWRKLIFAEKPIDSSDYKPINEWNSDDYYSYLRWDVVPKSTTALAFLAIAICLLLGFFIWRIVKASCVSCCHRCQGTHISQEVLQRRSMIIVKIVGLLICLGICITAIYGLAFPKPNSVQEGWTTVNTLGNYSQEVADALDLVVTKLQDTQALVTSTLALGRTLPQNIPPFGEINQQLLNIRNQLGAILTSLPESVDRFRQNVVVTFSRLSNDHEEQTLYYWSIAVKVSMGVFGAALLVMLLVFGTAAFNWGWGVAVCTVLQLLLVLVFFVIAAALGGLLVVLSDTCSNMEVFVVQLAPAELQPLVSFYVNPNSLPSGLETRLADSDLVNITEVRGLLDPLDSLKTLVDGIVPVVNSLGPSLPATLRQTATDLISRSTNLTSQGVAILAALGQSEPPPSGILGLARLEAVQPLYSNSKEYLCCNVPAVAAELWTLMTVLGWLGMGLSVAAMAVLWWLDQTHEAGACCSCSCLRHKELPAPGKSADGGVLPNHGAPLEHVDSVAEVRVSGGRGAGVSSWLDHPASSAPGQRPREQQMVAGSPVQPNRQLDAAS